MTGEVSAPPDVCSCAKPWCLRLAYPLRLHAHKHRHESALTGNNIGDICTRKQIHTLAHAHTQVELQIEVQVDVQVELQVEVRVELQVEVQVEVHA